jgi:UDP-N-acetylmuramoyl-tripeptide--D-alanyl-D-alanine ligase
MDAYNANPSSMMAALENFASLDNTEKTVFLGDMFELGKFEAEEHQAIVNLCVALGLTADQVWLVGKAFTNTQASFKKFPDTQTCIQFLQSNPLEHAFVFLKGSRGMKLENLLDVIG